MYTRCSARSLWWLVLLSPFFLLCGCVPQALDTSEDGLGFAVGGASGPAPAGHTALAGGNAPGVFGTTGSVGVGTAGVVDPLVVSGPGFPTDFRLFSVANGRLVQLLVNPPTLVPIGAANLTGTAIVTAPDDTLFGLTATAAGTTQLVEISPTTGAVTPVQPVSNLAVFPSTGFATTPVAFAPTGTIYTSPGNILYRIDPITGQVTPVLSGTAFGAFTFGPTGTLVATTTTGLSTIDITTGVTTGVLASVSQIPFAPSIQGLTFGPDGFIYAVSDPFTGQSNLLRVDPLTGVSVVLASYNVNLFGLAVQPL